VSIAVPVTTMEIESNGSEYRDADVDFLLSTMREFMSQLKKEIATAELLSAAAAAIIGLVGTIFSFASIYLGTHGGFMQIFTTPIADSWRLAGLMGGFVTGTALGFVTIIVIRKISAHRREIRRLKGIVLTLARRASQLHDRGGMPFAQRIMLEVFITDAESMLNMGRPTSLGTHKRTTA
jgi:hypothetical protein